MALVQALGDEVTGDFRGKNRQPFDDAVRHVVNRRVWCDSVSFHNEWFPCVQAALRGAFCGF